MAKAATKRKKSGFAIGDLSEVEGRVLLPAGVYQAKVHSVEEHSGKKSDGLMWKFAITEGRYEGQTTKPFFTVTSGEGLFNLKNLLTALNYDIPEGEFELTEDEVVDLELSIEIAHEEYEGRPQANVVGFMEAGAEGSEPEEEEKPKPKTRAEKRRAAKEAEAEAEEKPKASAKKTAGKKTSKKEEPEEEKLTEEDINAMDTEELEALIEEHDIDVDLSKLRSLSKQRAAVIKAAGDLIE